MIDGSGVERAESTGAPVPRPEPRYDNVTWGNIPMGCMSVMGVIGPDGVYIPRVRIDINHRWTPRHLSATLRDFQPKGR